MSNLLVVIVHTGLKLRKLKNLRPFAKPQNFGADALIVKNDGKGDVTSCNNKHRSKKPEEMSSV